jgi:hypothetical protein
MQMSVIDRTTTAPPASLLDMQPIERAQMWADEQLVKIRLATERRLLERAAAAANGAPSPNGAAGIGAVIVNDYVSFEIACTSPFQVAGLPPYLPGKVIAGGEEAFILAVLFVNPTASVADGFAVPPTVQLAGRDFRVRYDEMNVSDVTTGSNVANPLQTGTFGSPAASFTSFLFRLNPPDPGVNPKLFEANISADIDGFVQPYSAFVTNFLDLDGDPGFPFAPPTAPGFRNLIPNRYLVFQQ